jgi:3-keto-disaccharide hydrolase
MTRTAILTILAAMAATAQPNRLTDVERAGGWRLLFDGESTAGWVEVTGKPFPSNCWTVEDGSLKALVRTDGFQDIRTRESFGSFELEFDWKLLRNGNSGVKYRIQNVDEWTNKAGRQARARGLEYQLADDANEDAAVSPRQTAGALYSLIAPEPRIPPRIGEFNHSRLVVRGDHVEHWLNGTRVVAFDLGVPEVEKLLRNDLPKGSPAGTPLVRRSPISLQNHSSEAWFRNIKVRPLAEP